MVRLIRLGEEACYRTSSHTTLSPRFITIEQTECTNRPSAMRAA
jgi:hypothetical protein